MTIKIQPQKGARETDSFQDSMYLFLCSDCFPDHNYLS